MGEYPKQIMKLTALSTKEILNMSLNSLILSANFGPIVQGIER